MCEREDFSQDYFSLAMGPPLKVHSYSGCIVGGVRFHMLECDIQRITLNSGVTVVGEGSEGGSADNNFYGFQMKRCTFNIHLDDVLGYQNVENEQLNVLKIVIRHRVNEHIEDGTLCRAEVDPTVVERPDVRHVDDEFIDNDDEQSSSPQSGSSNDE
ncbi:hypothetical protein E5676_scaffold110G001360 [Cucumis melo var. makuwa]|uniref:CACTA en-spm transposon protein n=1 Tax=Cucumis melo var. makuwa TaxID=1194695 RepID=A0A5D3BBI5_CUCMM|nr:hypothetical protein E6C27_scaffold20G00630 [Cucumis melo var. makuwa]TYJ95845.1 hypothetical protein E5676_scaffold110G001360 [Cucumis melo var. makuwa]